MVINTNLNNSLNLPLNSLSRHPKRKLKNNTSINQTNNNILKLISVYLKTSKLSQLEQFYYSFEEYGEYILVINNLTLEVSVNRFTTNTSFLTHTPPTPPKNTVEYFNILMSKHPTPYWIYYSFFHVLLTVCYKFFRIGDTT